MTKEQLQTFVTSLLDGYEIEESLFDTLLNIAQAYWESRRPWMILRSEDTSQTIGTSNTYLTEKSLPADFRKWYTRFPIVLADENGNARQFLREVPLNTKLAHKSNNTKFYCNYATKKFYVCGTPSQASTAHIYYIRKAPLVSEGNEWEFDEEFHPLLGLSIAVYWKLGVDYDIINNAQGESNAALAAQMFSAMTEWDGDLQESSIQGQDYGSDSSWSGNASGGVLPPDVIN